VDYGGESKLVFLSAIRSGEELLWEEAVFLFDKSGIPKEDVVETVKYTTFDEDFWNKLKAEQSENEEGFVIRFCTSGKRMKIKFDEYVRLHRLMISFSNLDIWEELRAGNDPIEKLGSVPDEFDEWIRAQISGLNNKYWSVIARAHLYVGILLEMGFETRREQALWINERVEIELRPLLFAILDDKRVAPIAWKIVRPEKRMPLRNSNEE
jgi:RNA ligase